MAILKKIYPLLGLALLTSCEEAFTPDMPHTPVLCINSLITAGQPIETKISKSRLYTDSSLKSIVSDADIRIYAGGELQPGSYIPKEGDDIKIVAVSPTVGRGEADVRIPASIPSPTAKWEAFDVSRWDSDISGVYISFKLKVDLSITDPEGDNYYKFSFGYPYDSDDPSDDFNAAGNYGYSIGSLVYDMEPIFSEHISVFESIMGGDAYGFTFFSDRQFAGKSYTLHLQFDSCWCRFPKGDIPDCKINMVISSVSPSYYNWANYVWQRDSGILPELGDYGLGDPIWGYSNVSTGAGVVAAQSHSVCTIDITEFIKNSITQTNVNIR